MSTANKLTYLNNTKQLLKQKINNLGGDIDNTTTFREYADELQDVYDNLPKTTGEGTEVSLNTVKGRMQITEKGNTEQDTSTQGKNYCHTNSDEWVIGQYNQDGTINNNDTTRARIKTLIPVPQNQTMYVTTGANDYVFVLRGYDSNKNFLISYGTVANTQTFNTISSGTNVAYLGVTIYNPNVQTGNEGQNIIDKISSGNIKPFICLNSVSDKTYEAFTPNKPSPEFPSPIKVVTRENTVVVGGKNLISGVESGGYSDITGNKIDNTDLYRNTTIIPVKPSTNYIFSINGTAQDINVNYYDINKNFIEKRNNTNALITTLSNAYYINIFRGTSAGNEGWQLEEGSTATTYEPYISPISKQLDLGNLEFAKIGTVNDVLFHAVSGDKYYDSLSAEDKATLDEGDWYKHNTIYEKIYNGASSENWAKGGNTHQFYISKPTDAKAQSVTFCNYFINQQTASQNGFWFSDNFINVNHLDYTEVSAFKTWLSNNNLKIKYQLATPTFTKITDTTLISQLEDIDNLMSNNGTTIISTTAESGNALMILGVSALKGA